MARHRTGYPTIVSFLTPRKSIPGDKRATLRWSNRHGKEPENHVVNSIGFSIRHSLPGEFRHTAFSILAMFSMKRAAENLFVGPGSITGPRETKLDCEIWYAHFRSDSLIPAYRPQPIEVGQLAASRAIGCYHAAIDSEIPSSKITIPSNLYSLTLDH